MAKLAQLAPTALELPSSEALLIELENQLRDGFSLQMLPKFSVIVEGWTDVHYLGLAVDLFQQAMGVDLLEIPNQISGINGARIGVVTPGSPGNPIRGGTPQMVRVAGVLKPYVFMLRAFQGLMFIFDHDEAGLEAATQLANIGFARQVNIMTLDPKEHPTACAKKQVCIEDLLSLDIQRRYFESTAATCSLDYSEGLLKRIQWGHASKPGLRDFVLQNAILEDVHEMVQLLLRVRRAFALPT